MIIIGLLFAFNIMFFYSLILILHFQNSDSHIPQDDDTYLLLVFSIGLLISFSFFQITDLVYYNRLKNFIKYVTIFILYIFRSIYFV